MGISTSQLLLARRGDTASARQQQLARQLRAQARASRPVGRAVQRLRRSLRIATARHTEIPA